MKHASVDYIDISGGYSAPVKHAKHQSAEREYGMDCFKTGLLIGITISALVVLLLMVFWVLPTVNEAVEATSEAVAMGAVR